MDDTDGPDLADPRLRVVSAVLYLAGLGLLVIGSVGAFLWSPVLWCAIVGLVLIAGAFVVDRWPFLTLCGPVLIARRAPRD